MTVAENVPTNILSKIQKISKLEKDHLKAYVGEVCVKKVVSGCQASAHFKFILNDGNDRPRVEDLARALAENVIDYAIPRSRRDEADEYRKKTGSSSKWVALARQAKNLFTNLAKTGEGGETLLYLLAETYLNLPQVSCKMPLKTNPKMHVHGTDGLHATFDHENEKLALYWCESKLYSTMSRAVSECFKSIKPYLDSKGGSKASAERDLQIMRDSIDLNDEALESAFLDYLDPASISFTKLEFRGICLIGFDSEVYPISGDKKVTDLIRIELENQVEAWTKQLSTQISKNKLADFNIEIFCLPFPDVEEFRKAFLRELV